MQLIVYLNGAICADELGYGHLLRQALCAKEVSAFQVLGAALLVLVPPFATAWHEHFGQYRPSQVHIGHCHRDSNFGL